MHDTTSSDHNAGRRLHTSAYRFDKLKTGHILDDMTFSRDAKRAGDRISNARLYTLAGQPTTLRQVAAGRRLLIVTGSITCPMTASAAPDLNELYRQYGDRVAFVQLYVREAHPGAVFSQPRVLADKIAHAEALRQRFGVRFPVLVDDVDGTLHRELDAIANSAHLLEADGTLLFRSLWAGDAAAIEGALADAAAQRALTRVSSSRMMGPATLAFGYISDVLTTAGRGAKRDLLWAAAPMAMMSGLANLFRFVPKRRRGAFAVGTVFLGLLTAVAVLAIIL